MEELGEAFVFGVDDPASYLRGLGFDGSVEVAYASDLFDVDDPMFSLYRFAVASCIPISSDGVNTYLATDIDQISSRDHV